MDLSEFEYAGFWVCVWVSIIDTVLFGVFIWPLLTVIYGRGYWSSTDFVHCGSAEPVMLSGD